MKNPRDARQAKLRDTFHLLCPNCGALISLPEDEMDDLFKITECFECEQMFDYDIDEIKMNKDASNVE